MDETIYVTFKVQFDFALEVWFSKQIPIGSTNVHYAYHYYTYMNAFR